MKRKIKKHPILVIFSEDNYIDTSAFKGDYAFYAIEPNMLDFPELFEKQLTKEMKITQPKKVINYIGCDSIPKVCEALKIPHFYGQ